MEFQIKTGTAEKQRSACVILGVYDNKKLDAAGAAIDAACDGLPGRAIKSGDITGKAGETLLLHTGNSRFARVLLVGCGDAKKALSAADYRKIALAALKTLHGTKAANALFTLSGLEVDGHDLAWKIRQLLMLSTEVDYSFELPADGKKDQKKKDAKEPPVNARIDILVADKKAQADAERALQQGLAIRNGMRLTRDLSNLPGNICTPTYLADHARQMSRQSEGLKATILDEKAMQKLGMGALLSVARGSRQPPRLIVLEYRGGKKTAKPVVLIGKGLTFDAGGISIKPAAGMDEMKYDMCGGASVFGVMQAVAELQLPLNVVGVIPSSENLPDGAANKPGDIVTSMSGQTIEILNTDAEGRLILCDALTYSKKFKPAAVIDIATLTGACVIALGSQASGLMGNDQALADALLAAGQSSQDRAWQLPLWDEYDEQLKSPFADMANIGGREAGTITAGCFLGRYAEDFSWAHLDIAGTAWKGGAAKGATGRPVPLLMHYLLEQAGVLS